MDNKQRERLIAKAKSKIRDLSEEQDEVFSALKTELQVTDEGDDILFDYLFNNDWDSSFRAYVTRLKPEGPLFND